MSKLACKSEVLLKLQHGKALCVVRSFACEKEGPCRQRAIHYWVKELLSSQLNVPAKQVTFARSETGKPWLPEYPWLHFNLSHSGTLAAVAVSIDQPVGIDIEKISGKSEIKKQIAQRFFHKDELVWLLAQEGDFLLQFTKLWSLKEAWLKLAGTGLRQSLASFNVTPTNDGLADVIATNGQPIGRLNHQTVNAEVTYCLAFGIEQDHHNPPIEWRVFIQ